MTRSPFQAVFGRPAATMEKYLLALVLVYVVVVGVKNPLFFSLETLFDMLRSGAGTMILAAGVLVVLISGGIDVSFTAVAIVSGYVSTRTMMALGLDDVLLALVLAAVVGVLLGSVNALLIHFLRLPALIVTLGTMSVFHGAMAVLLATTS